MWPQMQSKFLETKRGIQSMKEKRLKTKLTLLKLEVFSLWKNIVKIIKIQAIDM